MPNGDLYTRGAIFDILVSNTSSAILDIDIEPHLPYRDVIDYRKLVTFEDPWSKNKTLESIVDNFNLTKAVDFVTNINKVSQLYQFSINPNHRLISVKNRNKIDPRDDAFTFTMKTMLRTLCNEKMYHFTNCN